MDFRITLTAITMIIRYYLDNISIDCMAIFSSRGNSFIAVEPRLANEGGILLHYAFIHNMETLMIHLLIIM